MECEKKLIENLSKFSKLTQKTLSDFHKVSNNEDDLFTEMDEIKNILMKVKKKRPIIVKEIDLDYFYVKYNDGSEEEVLFEDLMWEKDREVSEELKFIDELMKLEPSDIVKTKLNKTLPLHEDFKKIETPAEKILFNCY